MLVYLADPKSSLKSLLDTVEEFGSYSGLRVNWAKSVLYPIDDLPIHENTVKSTLLVVDQFTILGIDIHIDMRQFATLISDPHYAIY